MSRVKEQANRPVPDEINSATSQRATESEIRSLTVKLERPKKPLRAPQVMSISLKFYLNASWLLKRDSRVCAVL